MAALIRQAREVVIPKAIIFQCPEHNGGPIRKTESLIRPIQHFKTIRSKIYACHFLSVCVQSPSGWLGKSQESQHEAGCFQD